MSVIKRNTGAKIVREHPKGPFHAKNEVMAAQEQLGGHFPRASTKSWYRDIYDYYQNNEC
jgi:hypothetical protein